jgi:hypothetical protein
MVWWDCNNLPDLEKRLPPCWIPSPAVVRCMFQATSGLCEAVVSPFGVLEDGRVVEKILLANGCVCCRWTRGGVGCEGGHCTLRGMRFGHCRWVLSFGRPDPDPKPSPSLPL